MSRSCHDYVIFVVILSLVDISLIHRRAEVMLGVLPASPLGLSTAAMLVIFQFFFKAMRFRKLYSFVYEDNRNVSTCFEPVV
jgi:hypothetical protein